VKRFVIGNDEDFLQIDFEMLEEISLIAHFNGTEKFLEYASVTF
jgi:hypothetical protein